MLLGSQGSASHRRNLCLQQPAKTSHLEIKDQTSKQPDTSFHIHLSPFPTDFKPGSTCYAQSISCAVCVCAASQTPIITLYPTLLMLHFCRPSSSTSPVSFTFSVYFSSKWSTISQLLTEKSSSHQSTQTKTWTTTASARVSV